MKLSLSVPSTTDHGARLRVIRQCRARFDTANDVERGGAVQEILRVVVDAL